MSTLMKAVTWILRLLSAAIMLQTLYFKFSGSEESVYIFSAIGLEPWGRIGTGVMELIASILLLLNRSVVYGALLAIALMAGAIFFHLTKIGLIVKDDGGLLFGYALTVMISCVVVLFIFRNDLRFMKNQRRVY